jgi:serine/threonine protein phosphatase PrpC
VVVSRVDVDLLLRCPSCGCTALAGDQFCEACGEPVGAARDEARHHQEVDLATAAGVTDRGLVHGGNDDSVHVDVTLDGTVLVVCDGVSASTAPDVAAQLAVETAGRAAGDALRQRDPLGSWDAAEVVRAAIADAAAAVAAVPWLPIRDRGAPSCTVVLALWDGLHVTVGWIGDSRAYWVDRDACWPLTVDHSWAEEQVGSGRLSREAAEADGRAHAITRWLGADAPPGSCPVRTIRPERPGRLLACSDGLWNYAPEPADVARLVAEQGAGNPLTTARALVRYALSRGGQDNVTVAVADIVPLTGLQEGP